MEGTFWQQGRYSRAGLPCAVLACYLLPTRILWLLRDFPLWSRDEALASFQLMVRQHRRKDNVNGTGHHYHVSSIPENVTVRCFNMSVLCRASFQYCCTRDAFILSINMELRRR